MIPNIFTTESIKQIKELTESIEKDKKYAN